MSTLLTVTESAGLAHVSPQTITRWIKAGKIKPAIQTGHTVRIALSELAEKCNVSMDSADERRSTASIDLKGAHVTPHTDELLAVLTPYLLQLLSEAPEYGEISLSATIHQGTIGRVRVGTEISRAIPSSRDGRA